MMVRGPRIRPWASSARIRGSRSPAISASIIARPDLVNLEEATAPSLITASSRVLSTRWVSEVRVWTSRLR
jgi:hypothetical protein